MYSNNILNFEGSMTILKACTKKSGNLLYVCISIHINTDMLILYGINCKKHSLKSIIIKKKPALNENRVSFTLEIGVFH